MKRVVLVSGSRDFPSKELVMDVMRKSFRAGDCLIHGCARGVDSWAEEAARSAGVPVSRRPADWDRYGKSAGMLRNSAMLHETLGMLRKTHDRHATLSYVQKVPRGAVVSDPDRTLSGMAIARDDAGNT
jgi:hypothetical protein